MTQGQVAAAIGVSRQAVQQWASGVVQPSIDNLKRLAEVLQVRLDDLAGPEKPDYQFADVNEPEREDYIRVPVLDAEASCGGGTGAGSTAIVEAVDFLPAFIHSLPGVVGGRNLHIVHAFGDSMEPTIANRSFCLVDESQGRITSDGVFCLQADNQIFIKRIQRNIDGTFTLISDNSCYPPQRVDKATMQTVNVIGRVVYAFNGVSI